MNWCCCEREIPVESLVQSAVHIFGKAAFQNFPTTGCTCGSTEIYLALGQRERSVFVLAAARFELLCVLRDNAPAVKGNAKFVVKNVPENLVTWFW